MGYSYSRITCTDDLHKERITSVAYNYYDLASDMEAYSKLIERNAWGKGKQADGIQKANTAAYLKLSVLNEMQNSDISVAVASVDEFVDESDGSTGKPTWVKKARTLAQVRLISKHRQPDLSLDELLENEEL